MPRSTPQYYLPAQGDILSPGAAANGALSQFDRFVAACGEYAAEILYAIQDRVAPSPAHADALVSRLASEGLATTQGTTSLEGLRIGLAQEGIQSSVVDNWRQVLAGFGANRKPAILLFQNAQALPGDESGLFGHFATVEGFSPSTNKFVVADSDNQAAKTGRLNLYSFSQIVAADPVGALVANGPVGGGPSSPSGTIPIVGGVGDALGGISSGVLVGAASGIGGLIGTGFHKATGVNSVRDLLFRTVLIIAGVLIVLASIVAIILPHAQAQAQQAEQVAPAAAMMAG